MPRSNSLPLTLLGLLGVGGLVGLLVAGAHYPDWAFVLRVGAILWFLATGVFKFLLDLRNAAVPSEERPLSKRPRAGL